MATLTEPIAGTAVSGRPGDLLIERGRARVVVAALADSPEARGRRGSILDAALGDWETDSLHELTPLVTHDGTELMATVERIEPLEHERGPGVRVVRRVAQPALEVVTDVVLVEPGPHLEVETRVASMAPVAALSVGDRLRLHGPRAFVPGAGYVAPTWYERLAPWVGQEGRRVSYALSFDAGAAEIGARFERTAATEIVALDAPRALEAGRTLRWRRRLWLAEGGLERVAGAAWRAAGVATVDAEVRIRGGDGERSVVVEAPTGPVLTARLPSSGALALPLPHGRYRVVLRAPGGRDAAELTVGAAGATLDRELLAPVAGRLSVRVHDGAGKPLPARVMLRGVNGTPNPDLGSDERAAGMENVAYTVTGALELELPPGSYHALATHGPEFTLADATFEVSERQGVVLRPTLTRVVDKSGWVACDLHLHAAPSFDSRVPLEDRITALVAEGVDFAVATDHNHVTDYAPTIDALALGSVLASAAGVEITTQTWGHFNAYPLPPGTPAPAWLAATPSEIFQAVRGVSADAVIQVNHPRMGTMGYFNRTGLDPATGLGTAAEYDPSFDAIELFNGLELGKMDQVEGLLEEWFHLLASGHRYTAVGSSDSHRLVHHWAGYPRTYVAVPMESSAPLVQAVAASIRAGRAMVTNGPFLDVTVDGASPGATVSAPSGVVKLAVNVHAPPWIAVDTLELVTSGQRSALVGEVGEGSLRLAYRGEVRLARDGWIVVVARGKGTLDAVLPGSGATPLAFTNPIFVDVDDAGSAPPAPAP